MISNTVFTKPTTLRCVGEVDTFKVKPLNFTVIVITSYHVSKFLSLTETV